MFYQATAYSGGENWKRDIDRRFWPTSK